VWGLNNVEWLSHGILSWIPGPFGFAQGRQGRHDPIRNYGVGLFRTGQAEADMANFVLLSKAKYMELLEKYGFHSQAVQLSLFDELKRKKGRK